jgi:large subunit ribosomal protein L5
MTKARLQERYETSIRPTLKKQLGLANVMQVPKINKIVLNIGLGRDVVTNSKQMGVVVGVLKQLAGQQPVQTLARKSIAGFKIREGMPLGAKVTLRGRNMYEFLDRLVTVALPAVRDFQGVSANFDQNGNYNLGIREWVIFPEVSYDAADKVYGLNVTIDTTAKNAEHAYELLKSFGMPFRKAQG